MPDFNEESIRTLSRLCRIEVTEEEIPALLHDLKRVLDYVAQLQEVDVSDLPPFSHIEAVGVGALRDDVVAETLTREEFLANAPEHIGGMVRVPPVIKPAP